MDSPKKKEIYGSYYVLIEDGHDSTLWDSIYEGSLPSAFPLILLFPALTQTAPHFIHSLN